MLATVVSSVNHCTYWIRAHANDLRAEVAKETANTAVTYTFVTKAAKDWKTEGLNSTDEALCAFGEKRTQTTDSMLKKDIRQLEDLGFTHTAVHDAVQVLGQQSCRGPSSWFRSWRKGLGKVVVFCRSI